MLAVQAVKHLLLLQPVAPSHTGWSPVAGSTAGPWLAEEANLRSLQRVALQRVWVPGWV